MKTPAHWSTRSSSVCLVSSSAHISTAPPASSSLRSRGVCRCSPLCATCARSSARSTCAFRLPLPLSILRRRVGTYRSLCLCVCLYVSLLAIGRRGCSLVAPEPLLEEAELCAAEFFAPLTSPMPTTGELSATQLPKSGSKGTTLTTEQTSERRENGQQRRGGCSARNWPPADWCTRRSRCCVLSAYATTRRLSRSLPTATPCRFCAPPRSSSSATATHHLPLPLTAAAAGHRTRSSASASKRSTRSRSRTRLRWTCSGSEARARSPPS